MKTAFDRYGEIFDKYGYGLRQLRAAFRQKWDKVSTNRVVFTDAFRQLRDSFDNYGKLLNVISTNTGKYLKPES